MRRDILSFIYAINQSCLQIYELRNYNRFTTTVSQEQNGCYVIKNTL